MDIEVLNRFDRYCLRLFGAFCKNRPGTGNTLVEVAVVNEVYMHPGTNANKVASFLGVDSGYMTRIVRGLEDRGVIERVSSPCDRRSKDIFLTDEGRDLALARVSETSEYNASLLSGLDDDEVDEVLRSMDRIMTLLSRNVPTDIVD